jgi:hypothetical protein
MADSDADIIDEARALTDYDEGLISDSTFQQLVDIGKEELEEEFSTQAEPFVGFYNGNQAADRALFWFTCIAAKVRAGEIAGVNLTVGSIRATSYSNSKFDFWFDNFNQKFEEATGGKPSRLQNLSRDNRTYGDNA